jgi:hypothetical protein
MIPFKMATEKIPNDGNLDMHIEKKITEHYNRGDNCHDYDNSVLSFLDCAKKSIVDVIAINITCMTPDLKYMLANVVLATSKPLCTTREERYNWLKFNLLLITIYKLTLQDRQQ